jgi:hypothetical protein
LPIDKLYSKTEVIPDLTPLLRPTRLGDVATYFFLSLGGLFIGGETGAISGSVFAGRAISKDPESRVRIMTAYKRLRADILRKEADMLDRIHM